MVTNNKEYQRGYYKKNKEKIYKSQRKWVKKNRDKNRKLKEKSRKKNSHLEKNKVKVREKAKKYKKKYPEKAKAHRLARTIPLKDHCQICGSIDRLERHHQDYSKPYDVLTVCKDCHTKIHMGVI